jgi:hypothetical protein
MDEVADIMGKSGKPCKYALSLHSSATVSKTLHRHLLAHIRNFILPSCKLLFGSFVFLTYPGYLYVGVGGKGTTNNVACDSRWSG